MASGREPRHTVLVPLLVFTCLLWCGGSFFAGFAHQRAYAAGAEEKLDLSLVWEVWHHIEQHFYGSMPTEQELTYGAIEGALETLHDPYTRLVRPVAHERDLDRLRGRFGGIGAWVYECDGFLCLRPLPGSAAEEAGVRAGDRLVSVDGNDVGRDATTELVVSWIRGPVGTAVVIEVFRPETGDTLSFSIERSEILQPSVEWQLLDSYAPLVGYVKVTLFGERTPKELQQALAEVRRQGADLLVLDLRGNPGGLLDAAVEVSSQFLKRGIVLREVRADGTERVYRVRPRVRVDEPLAVLVDQDTASAAEIVAGALQDHERAVLVGTRTRGKGSVQLAYELSDGSSLHVTAAVWLTPDQREINGVGLEPDYYVEAGGGSGEDEALQQALEVLGAQVVADSSVPVE